MLASTVSPSPVGETVLEDFELPTVANTGGALPTVANTGAELPSRVTGPSMNGPLVGCRLVTPDALGDGRLEGSE